MQKYELSRQKHKMTIVLVMVLFNSLLHKAGIGHKNTYDMRAKLPQNRFEFSSKIEQQGL